MLPAQQKTHLVVLLLILGSACTADLPSQPACDAIAQHLQSCGLTLNQLACAAEPGAASVLLEQSCDELRATKADEVGAFILAEGLGSITVDILSFLRGLVAGSSGETGFRLPSEGFSMEAHEMALVRQALEASDGNQSAAAKLLGLTRAKFRVLVKRLGEA